MNDFLAGSYSLDKHFRGHLEEEIIGTNLLEICQGNWMIYLDYGDDKSYCSLYISIYNI